MKQATQIPATRDEVAASGMSRRTRAAVVAGVGAALVLTVVLIVRSASPDALPRLNEDTVTLARFVNTSRYAELPFDRQWLYMKVLEDREDNDELKKAYDEVKLAEPEYRAAKLEAWLGEQLKRSERYASLPPGPARARYMAELVDRKLEKKAKEARSRRPSAAVDDDDDVKRDATVEKLRIDAWPTEVRMRWQEYRKAYKELKELREKPATRPVEG